MSNPFKGVNYFDEKKIFKLDLKKGEYADVNVCLFIKYLRTF